MVSMARQALPLVESSYTTALSRLNSSTASLSQLHQTHAQILKTGYLNHPDHTTKLLSLYANAQHFSDATLLLECTPDPDILSFTTLISACSKSDHSTHVLRLVRRMLSHCLLPDHYVFPSVLKACSGLLAVRLGRQVHSLASVTGFALDSFVQSGLLHMYVKCGEIKEAHKVFDTITDKNVVSWSALIAGYARQGFINEAKEVFYEMRSLGVEPNLVSWNGLIAGFNQNELFAETIGTLQKMHLQGFRLDGTTISSVLPVVGDLEDLKMGIQIHGYVIKHGHEPDKCFVSALIDMYGKCGCPIEMKRVFRELARKELGSCNALVAGLSRNGFAEDALDVLKHFKEQKVELNVVSWTSVIACCTQNGKDIEALQLFREMQLAEVKPNSVTIPCLLPACANTAALMHGKAAHCFSLRRGISCSVYVASALIDMYAKCGRIVDFRHCFDRLPSRDLVLLESNYPWIRNAWNGQGI